MEALAKEDQRFSFQHFKRTLSLRMQKLLRRSLIALAICLGAVVVCYFWIDRPTAFFVGSPSFGPGEGFSLAHLPPAGTTDLVAADPDRTGVAANLGSVGAVATDTICRVPQFDCNGSI